jgi:predicted Zn-dependent protease
VVVSSWVCLGAGWDDPEYLAFGFPADHRVARFEENSVPSNLTEAATEADIRQGSRNMTHGLNNCGYPTNSFIVTTNFLGNTNNSSNIGNNTACLTPDGQNVVEWIDFDSNHASTLGFTCWWSDTAPDGTKKFTEADIAFAKNAGIVDSYPSPCSNRFDLQTVATHEWGHAMGLAHESSGLDEVMYPFETPCATRRNLGKGDYNGMSTMYG